MAQSPSFAFPPWDSCSATPTTCLCLRPWCRRLYSRTHAPDPPPLSSSGVESAASPHTDRPQTHIILRTQPSWEVSTCPWAAEPGPSVGLLRLLWKARPSTAAAKLGGSRHVDEQQTLHNLEQPEGAERVVLRDELVGGQQEHALGRVERTSWLM